MSEKTYMCINCKKEFDKIESSVCTWYKVMKLNLTGEGTSFDKCPDQYSKQQKKCYCCDGFDTECRMYNNK